jgi:hypothetical protein
MVREKLAELERNMQTAEVELATLVESPVRTLPAVHPNVCDPTLLIYADSLFATCRERKL